MTTQQLDYKDDLPLLTEVVGDASQLPILTDIVTGEPGQEATDAEKRLVEPLAIRPGEQTTLAKSQVMAGHQDETCELETGAVQDTGVTKPALPHALSKEDTQQLLRLLETHLETVFTSGLNTQLEQLQRLAVDLAVSEFKAELPKLLRDALKTQP
jgi:hypothetical protein